MCIFRAFSAQPCSIDVKSNALTFTTSMHHAKIKPPSLSCLPFLRPYLLFEMPAIAPGQLSGKQSEFLLQLRGWTIQNPSRIPSHLTILTDRKKGTSFCTFLRLGKNSSGLYIMKLSGRDQECRVEVRQTQCDPSDSPRRKARRARTSVTYCKASNIGTKCRRSLSVGSLIQPSMGIALSALEVLEQIHVLYEGSLPS